MDYVNNLERALDFMEENLRLNPKLEAIADAACYSPYHFCRVFAMCTGESPVEYLRKRRLSEAAKEIKQSEKSITQISFEWNFGSSQAFSRAFTEQFKQSPMAWKNTKDISLSLFKEKIDSNILRAVLKGVFMEPVMKQRNAMKLIGLTIRTKAAGMELPNLWEAFNKRFIEIADATGEGCIGLESYDNSYMDTGEWWYSACAIVSTIETIPDNMIARTLPASEYAVFTVKGPISKIPETFKYAYYTWLPNSGYESSGCWDFELYDSRFNFAEPEKSEMEIWLPVKKKA